MPRTLRCAIYTRKSSEEGLDQDFNSLQAQREACAAYVASQKAEGWVLLPTAYDDGGLSGGTLERPALQRLLADIEAGQIDQIVVYKIDRLTRSLSDFAKIVDRLDAADASFVSVTQSFNTATSMGRLTLNMLLSFAQFEREVTAERIRDKIAASKQKGLWMGGHTPLGYHADGRSLAIDESEAQIVRTLYDLYEEHGTVREVQARAAGRSLRTRRRVSASGAVRGGELFSRGHIHHILTNPIYAGRIRHKGQVYPGQHPPLIAPERWDRLQAQITRSGRIIGDDRAAPRKRATAVSPLAGKLYDETGDHLTPSHAKTRSGTRLRYYVSNRLIRRSGERGLAGWRLPAADLEAGIAALLRERLRASAFLHQVVADLTADEQDLLTQKVSVVAGENSDAQPADLQGLVQFVARIDLAPGHIALTLDSEPLAEVLGLPVARIVPDALRLEAAFQHRKRGVETKLIIGEATIERDPVLIRNIARAHRWFELLTAGQTPAQIAAQEGTSRRRVVRLMELAFLSPRLVGQILEGRQPAELTTERLIRNGVPVRWEEQERL